MLGIEGSQFAKFACAFALGYCNFLGGLQSFVHGVAGQSLAFGDGSL